MVNAMMWDYQNPTSIEQDKYYVLATRGQDERIVAFFDDLESALHYIKENKPEDVMGSDWDRNWSVKLGTDYIIYHGKII